MIANWRRPRYAKMSYEKEEKKKMWKRKSESVKVIIKSRDSIAINNDSCKERKCKWKRNIHEVW